MYLLNKFIFITCLYLFTTFAYADTSNDIINKLSDKVSSFVENTLGGDTEFSLEFPENDEVELELLKFKELDSSENQNSFSQFSLHTQEVNDDTRFILNLGYGQRYISSDKSMITGMNAFIDYDTEGHARTSLGVEAKAPILELTGNYYLGLSGVETIDGTKEKVLDGYELNLSSQLPYMPWTRINIQNYDFEKDKASENTGGNLVSLEMNLSPSIQFEASRNFIDTSGVEDENSFKIMYYNPPRNKTSLQDGFLSASAFEKGDVEAKMKDKVRRRNAMTIEVQGAVVLTKQ
ncbi:hypothetical protein AKH19_05575 [Pelagibacteraceae bacterium GOM-A1]|jgi:hypothetical protein|nr:hypothetical protein AKH19_05575 [Pelagibacteraceae bacterium GOM-A1]